jgi:hypothetical protein
MDSTNQGISAPGVTPGGSVAQMYAIKRLQRQGQRQAAQQPGRVMPPSMLPKKV